MVADSRAKMNEFFIGISYLVVNECRLDMFIRSMYIYSIMGHAEHRFDMFIYSMYISSIMGHAEQIEE